MADWRALSSIQPLLPLQADLASGCLEWPLGVSGVLEELARGPQVSRVWGGSSLFDCIVELRQRSGMKRFKLPEKAEEGLVFFFQKVPSENFSRRFFESLLPSMARLALNLPALLGKHVKHAVEIGAQEQNHVLHLRLLPAGARGFVLISQELAASILTCAFLCLYPTAERGNYDLPDVNFDTLYKAIPRAENQAQKMICVLHYFQRVCECMPQGMISFERKVLWLEEMEVPDAAFWSSSSQPLCQFLVLQDGTIEGTETTALEVDFANKYLGGGVLRLGCLQEEIRFIINPELISGLLFLPAMRDNEAIEIVGSERYSQYKGYGSSFQYAGDFLDSKPRDSWGRRSTHIIAIDALPHPGEKQFELEFMLRELNKAFCGFLNHHSNGRPRTENILGVATGNWGCGVFGGDHEVKSVLQWLAASEARRPFLLYYTFNDQRTNKLQRVAEWILQEKWSVCDLWSVLMEYGQRRQKLGVGLFDWLLPDPDEQPS